MMFALKDPIFKGNFRVFIGDFAAVTRHVTSRGMTAENLAASTLARTVYLEKDGRTEVLFWFRAMFDPRTPADAAVLAHEAMHGATWVLRHRGVLNGNILDEVGNYYVEWLVREIATRARRRR